MSRLQNGLFIFLCPYRINPNREFFEIEDTQAIELLRIMCVEDVTPSLNSELEKVDVVSRDSGKRMKAKRPNLNFEEMGIPVNSILHSNYNHESCEVMDTKKVKFRDEVMSLTRATRMVLELDYSVAHSSYWAYSQYILLLMIGVLLSLIVWPDLFRKNMPYRILGDGVFYLPELIFL